VKHAPFLVLASLCALLAAPANAADQNAKLSQCSITFNTHNDNKDHDTILNVHISNKTTMFLSQEICGADDLNHDQEFKDPSNVTINLPVKGNITLKDVTLPVVNIHIQPNGHDRWIFDYSVSLKFEDGSVFTSSHSGVILDQDNKDYSGVFQSS
jgi:hypothetical protein